MATKTTMRWVGFNLCGWHFEFSLNRVVKRDLRCKWPPLWEYTRRQPAHGCGLAAAVKGSRYTVYTPVAFFSFNCFPTSR